MPAPSSPPPEVSAAPPRPSFVSGIAWNAVLTGAAWPVGVATAVLVGRWLGPEGKGEYTLATLAGGLLYALLNLGIPSAISYYLGGQRAPQPAFVKTVVELALLLSAVALVVALGLDRTGWSAYVFGVRRLPAAAWIVVLGLPFFFLGTFLQFVILAQGRQKMFAVLPAVGQLFISVLSLLLIVTGRLTPLTAAAALVASHVLTAVLLLGFTERSIGWWKAARLSLETVRGVTRYSALSYAGNALQFLVQRLDVLLLSSLQDLRQVGLYAVAYGSAEVLLLLPQRFGVLYMPRVAGAASTAERDLELPRASSLVLLGTVVCAAALAMVAPWALPLLYGRPFAPSVLPFLLLLPGVAALAASSILGAFLAGVGRVTTNLQVAAAALALNLVLNLFLIPRYGARAAAAVSSLTYIFQTILLARAAAQITGVPPLAMFSSASPGLLWALLRRALRLPAASPSLG